MEEPTEEAKTYRFYGRRDGSLVFLHPLHLKLLIAAVGGIENLPEALPELRVAHAERFEQSPATRKRFPWLAHVPIGSDVTLLDARGDGGFGSEFTERCRRAREGDPALRDALAARAKTIKRDQERSSRAERRHTHNVEKRLAEKAPVRAAPYIHQEGDFEPVEPEITEELQARAEAALGAAPTAMSFANTVARNFAAPEGAFPLMSPWPRRSRQPRRRRGRPRRDAGRPARSRALRGATDGSAAAGVVVVGRPWWRGSRRRGAAAEELAEAQAGEEDALADGRRPALLVYVYFVLRTCKKDFWGTGIAAADVSSRAHVFKFQTVSVDAVVSDVAEALSSVAGGDTTGTLGQSISSRRTRAARWWSRSAPPL